MDAKRRATLLELLKLLLVLAAVDSVIVMALYAGDVIARDIRDGLLLGIHAAVPIYWVLGYFNIFPFKTD